MEKSGLFWIQNSPFLDDLDLEMLECQNEKNHKVVSLRMTPSAILTCL